MQQRQPRRSCAARVQAGGGGVHASHVPASSGAAQRRVLAARSATQLQDRTLQTVGTTKMSVLLPRESSPAGVTSSMAKLSCDHLSAPWPSPVSGSQAQPSRQVTENLPMCCGACLGDGRGSQSARGRQQHQAAAVGSSGTRCPPASSDLHGEQPRGVHSAPEALGNTAKHMQLPCRLYCPVLPLAS